MNTVNIQSKNPNTISLNTTYNNQIYINYLDNINSQLIYLNEIEKDLFNLIQTDDNNTDSGLNTNIINICDYNDMKSKNKEIILSDDELEEGYKSGPCFYNKNKNIIIKNDVNRSNSLEKSSNIKRSFLNNCLYPITTTIYLDVEKRNKKNLRSNEKNLIKKNINRNNMVDSSPIKNKLNINYLRKVKTNK